ncbi:MAG: choice-of-anchor I family protein [Verrucomicrobiae bacterium]|nr:choice-of-anchor I family protein [Verrucomicrobiae bacterium]
MTGGWTKWLCLGLCAWAGSTSAQTTIQILHASDLEGSVVAIQDAANFAAVVQALENNAAANSIPSILLSAGDNYIPGPFFSAAGDIALRTPLRTALGWPQAREAEGRADIAIMNIIGFDASALGNHEFDLGTAKVRELIGPDIRPGPDARWLGADFPYLSCNLDFSADPNLSGLVQTGIVANTEFKGSLGDLTAAAAKKKLASATIIVRDGQEYGVVGVTTPLLETISSPGQTKVKNPGAGTNNMALLATIVQPVIDQLLARGINKIILVTHLQQLAFEQQLIPLLRGVDIVIGGGSDTILANATDRLRTGDVAAGPYPLFLNDADGNPVALLSTDGRYRYVGRLVIQFDAAGNIVPSSVDPNVSGAYVTDSQGVQDLWGNLTDPFLPGTKAARVKIITDALTSVVINKDSNVVGNSAVFLEGRRAFVRTQQTNLGDLSADANLWYAQQSDPTVRVSLKNGGGIRDLIGYVDGMTGALLPTRANPLSGKQETQVSQLDIENTLRFNNGLTLLTVTAAELLQILEHGVAATAPGQTPGQFPQVGGVRFSFDPDLPPGSRVLSASIMDWDGTTLDVLKQDGVLLGDPNRPIRLVTLNFLANGGDAYPFPALAENRVDLLTPGVRTGGATFADNGTEQDAMAEYFLANHPNLALAFDHPDLTLGQDDRIQNLNFRSDSAAYPPVPPDGAPRMHFLSRYNSGLGAGAAEITAYHAPSRQLFVVNATSGSVDVVSLAVPTNPTLVTRIDIAGAFSTAGMIAAPNSVAVSSNLIAVAIERRDSAGRHQPGLVAFYNPALRLVDVATAGALPDMVTFAPNGAWVVVANEGEPSPDYSFDPEGSVTVVNVARLRLAARLPFTPPGLRLTPKDVRQVSFAAFNSQRDALRAAGVRLFGPNATVAQDLEPEYVSVAPNSILAYVTLQENNAVAVINLLTARALAIRPLGYKDWTLSGLDASDRDNAINIAPWPVLGMYQPDAMACFEAGGVRYLVTANEGDGRDYSPVFNEEVRLRNITLDATAFPNRAALRDNAALGRLVITSTLGDTDNDGDYDQVYTFGGRSFSVWRVNPDQTITLVYDSADEMEQITASLRPAEFNGHPFDTRSDNKGPEPEGLALGLIDGRTYGFIGLERIGGVMMYELTNPLAPRFVHYVWTTDDVAPEGVEFVPASASPTGHPLVIVAHEISGTVVIYEVRHEVMLE